MLFGRDHIVAYDAWQVAWRAGREGLARETRIEPARFSLEAVRGA
jgi:hypothetical protein